MWRSRCHHTGAGRCGVPGAEGSGWARAVREPLVWGTAVRRSRSCGVPGTAAAAVGPGVWRSRGRGAQGSGRARAVREPPPWCGIPRATASVGLAIWRSRGRRTGAGQYGVPGTATAAGLAVWHSRDRGAEGSGRARAVREPPLRVWPCGVPALVAFPVLWCSWGRRSARCPKGYLNTAGLGHWVPPKPFHPRPPQPGRAEKTEGKAVVGREQSGRDPSPITGTADTARLRGPA